MERHQWLALFAWLAIPAVGFGYDGPQVPEEALAAVSQDARAGWAEREQQIAAMDRDIEAHRIAIEESEEPDAVEVERGDVRSARAEASEVRAGARSQLEVASYEVESARLERQSARQEKKLAKGELRLARRAGDKMEVIASKTDLNDARGELAAANGDLRVAKRSYADVKGETDRERDEADRAIAAAKQSRAEAETELAMEDVGADLAEAELAVMEAERDVALAELEFEQAQAAVATGYALELAPYGTALDNARVAEDDARQALRQVEREEELDRPEVGIDAPTQG